jgi:NAD(P)-dependent dehydrogenase (short-subunit alcohol dehydrogenase family)
MVSLQPCSLDDPTECTNLVNLALREFGRLDVVFNLAGRAHFGELEISATRIGTPPVATKST